MKSLFSKFRDASAPYEPLIEVWLSKRALAHNIDVFKNIVGSWGVAPVLKSNAYGHGLLEIARMLEGNSAIAFLVVDSYYEARVLRTEGITARILVLGYTLTENIRNNPFDGISFAVGSLAQLRDLAASIRTPLSIHVKVDTGMRRQGVMPDELSDAANIIAAHTLMRAEGLCSHLSDADGEDESFTRSQLTVWNESVRVWREKLPSTSFYHISATKGVRYAKDADANVLRLGLGLYGLNPPRMPKGADMPSLQPVLSLHTRITALRVTEPGEPVGYNRTWHAKRATRVATIPVGYYEGLDRRLSNKGFVEIRGVPCSIIGRVSMNMTMVDVTDVLGVREGDDVVVISDDVSKENSAPRIADFCDTIPYEILVHIPASLKRIVV